jgi:hypothetical protein
MPKSRENVIFIDANQSEQMIVKDVRNALSYLNENSRVELFSWSAIAHLTLCVWCRNYSMEAEVWQDDGSILINKINTRGRGRSEHPMFNMTTQLLEQLFNINTQQQ